MNGSMELFYQQLSEDWRMRDRMTWQMPGYLVVIGGVLLASLYSKGFGLEGTPIEPVLLMIGLGFSWIVTFFLARNIYLQAVGQDLLVAIRNGIDLEEVGRLARRVPLCREGYSVGHIILDVCTTLSSVLLLVSCSSLLGVFLLLLVDIHEFKYFLMGTGVALFTVFAIIRVSRCLFNEPEKHGHRIAGMVIILGYAVTVGGFVFDLYRAAHA